MARGWFAKLLGRRDRVDASRPVPASPASDLTEEPQDAKAWFLQGRALEAAQRWSEAITCYDRALEVEPRGASAWLSKGVVLAQLGRFRDALGCFEEAQRLGLAQAANGSELCRKKLREQAELAAAVDGLPAPRETDAGSPLVRPIVATGVAPEPARASEIRVFISSTFRDLQAEREQLVKGVFPELRRMCRARGVELTEIDLRWGVTEEEARQGKVIKICLEEIERCRPYFIGIIGARYGWTPSLEDTARDPRLLEAYPWLAQAIADARSVTEMEIVYGVLENPQMAEHAFFYFRDASAAASAEQVAGEPARLADLRARIRASGFPVHEGLPDAQSLGHAVRADLMAVIDRLYPAHLGPTPLERERRAHEGFAASRRRAYVEDPQLLDAIDAHAAGEGPPLAITGAPGVGKSALLAAWSDRYRRGHPQVFVIEHYIGMGAADTSHLGLLRRVIAEIRARYGLTEPVPETIEGLEQAFPEWLARLTEPLVLVVDALDQLDRRAAPLGWLPSHFPRSVRAIFSALDGATLEAVRRHGWRELQVPPLDVERREELIVRYLAEYRKTLSEPQRKRLSAAPQCANALFLRTLLEELRLFGTFEALDLRLGYYLGAADADELFQRVLERMEDDYGAATVKEVLTALWAARRGLAETEVIELTGVSRLDLSRVLVALDYGLVRRDGVLAFFHDSLRRAVRTRYCGDETRETAAHLRLADYFEPQAASERRAEELPWQLQHARAWDRLHDCLADLSETRSTTATLLDRHDLYEVLGYWVALGDRYDIAASYRASLADEAALERQEPLTLLKRFEAIGELLRHAGRYAAAGELLREALAKREQLAGPQDADTAAAFQRLALVREAEGEYAEAEHLTRRALAIREQVLGPDSLEVSGSLNTLASVLRARGDYAAAEPLFRRALAIREQVLGPGDAATAVIAGNLAGLLGRRGDYAGAESLFRRAAATWERVMGPEHPDTARSFANLGYLLYQRGRLLDAEPLLRRALLIRERTLGADHPDTAHSAETLASVLAGRGASDEAEALLRRALAIREKALGAEHADVAATMDMLAGVLDDRGDPGAQTLYRRALATKEKALGPDHPGTAMTLGNLGYLMVKLGNFEEAQALLRRALDIRERTLGPEHVETAVTLTNLAAVLRERDDYDGAEALLRRSLAVHERIHGSDHPDTARVLFNFGVILHCRQDLDGAEDAYQRALATQEKTIGPEHPDTLSTRNELRALLYQRSKTKSTPGETS